MRWALTLVLSMFAVGSVQAQAVAAVGKRPLRPLTEPMVSQMIVKLRAPAPNEQVRGMSATRARDLGRFAGAALAPFRPMSGDATVLKLETPLALSRAQDLAARLSTHADVEWAEPDLPVRTMQTPPDARYPERQWNLFPPNSVFTSTVLSGSGSKTFTPTGGANLPGAWTRTRGSAAVRVAVVDTGVVFSQPDLAPILLPGYDFVSASALTGATPPLPSGFVENDPGQPGRDADASDPGDWITAAEKSQYSVCDDGQAGDSPSSWHGTHMAGIIAAQWTAVSPNPAGTSTAGMAPGVRIVPVRALGKCGGVTSDVIDAMRWAAGLSVPGAPANPNPARVINLSLGATAGACSNAYQSAVAAVLNAGAMVVAAAGNDGQASVTQPANCPGVIAVAGHAINGDSASYSNYGTAVTISAPGGGDPTQLPLTTVLTPDDAAYYIWSTYLFGSTTQSSTVSSTDLQTGPAIGGVVGTSPATAHVSGVIALMLSVNSRLTRDQIRTQLTRTARSHPAGSFCATGQPGQGQCGAGLLDASAAVAAVPTSSGGGGAWPGWSLWILIGLALARPARSRR